jgi:hypothetical protein
MYAIKIPTTTPQQYISFSYALNLRYPSEDTGDWHFRTAFFNEADAERAAPLAGDGERVNTIPSLGIRGIREMSQILKAQEIISEDMPVYVANHYRAIADLAMLHLSQGQMPTIATAQQINDWLDTEAQVNLLVRDYLTPLRVQLDEGIRDIFDQWIATVRYE